MKGYVLPVAAAALGIVGLAYTDLGNQLPDTIGLKHLDSRGLLKQESAHQVAALYDIRINTALVRDSIENNQEPKVWSTYLSMILGCNEEVKREKNQIDSHDRLIGTGYFPLSQINIEKRRLSNSLNRLESLEATCNRYRSHAKIQLLERAMWFD